MAHSSPFAATSNPPAKWLQSVAKFFNANSQLGLEVLPYKEPEGLTTSSSSILLERHYLIAQAPKGKEAPEEGGALKGMTIKELIQ